MTQSTDIKWIPMKDTSRLAWIQSLKMNPSFTVETKNKRGQDRIVSVVRTNATGFNRISQWDVIIDGTHHPADIMSLADVLGLYLPHSVVRRFQHVIRKNKIFK